MTGTTIALSHDYFRRYIESTGLDRRIAMATSNFREGPQTPGSLRDTALDIRHMFVSTPLPDSITNAVLEELDPLLGQESDIVVDFDPVTKSGTAMRARTPASILEAVRLGWSGYWTPESIRKRGVSEVDDYPHRISVTIQAAKSTAPTVPGEELVRKYEELLGRVTEFPRTGYPGPDELDSVIEESISLRYRIAESCIVLMRPEEPWVLREVLFQRPQSEAFVSSAVAAGWESAARLLDIARESLELEGRLIDRISASPSRGEKHRPEEDGLSQRQLVGTPASSGRSSGRSCGVTVIEPDSIVVTADRIGAETADKLPITAGLVEGKGSRLGFGAVAAWKDGIPAVCGVSEAGLIYEGASMALDGDLGILTFLDVE